MKERWIEFTKRADFERWAEALHISPLTARILRNRDVETLEEARAYLYGTMTDLADPLLMKDLEKGAETLNRAVSAAKKIAIVSDFDDDGIFAGEILYEGLKRIGGNPKLYTPNRVREGYGINERIVLEAKKDGCSVILTCDNGIAALREIAFAREQGFTVVVTDHHDVQYETVPEEEMSGQETQRKYLLPPADAVLDPKQADCAYPYKQLCGAGVAFRLIQQLYRMNGVPEEEEEILTAYAAIATVADVVPLTGENRILVKTGLDILRRTAHPGLQALTEVCGLDQKTISSYHLGFVIGPAFNAVGRLSDVRLAFELLQEQDKNRALLLARQIRELNETRKAMTEEGTEEAIRITENAPWKDDPVYLIYLPDAHESVVGIIAGRLKEKYYHPVYVFTKSADRDEDGSVILKGSGRSVPGYHMLDGLLKHRELMTRFGGHAMAAGLSLREENLERLREGLNKDCTLTETEMTPVIYIDARLPLSVVSEELIRELDVIQPTGTGNTKAVFARPHFKIHSISVIGKERNSLKMSVSDGSGVQYDALLFREAEAFLSFLREEFGEEEVKKALCGKENSIDTAFCYAPSVNEYMGRKSIQIVCSGYCRIR